MERKIVIVHGYENKRGKSYIGIVVAKEVNEQKKEGWAIYSATTSVTMDNADTGHENTLWCTTIVFEK